VTTEVLGVKCEPKDAKLLGEFMTRLASVTTNDRDGVFLPRGAAYLLGTDMYGNVLKANEVFLNSIATIPVNLELDAWFAVINTHHASEDDPISLYDHLTRQPWFLRIESVAPKKCLLVTTHNNLNEARAWIDANLAQIIRKSIPDGIEPPSSLLPRRLDKPVYTATSLTYADILKKRISLDTTPTTTPVTVNNRPPRKRQATLINYDSDDSAASTAINAVPNNSSTNSTVSTPGAMAPPLDYAAELVSLKNEILSLRSIITEVVAQLSAIASAPTQSIEAPPATQVSNAMETEVNSFETKLDISDLIANLKKDIVTQLDISDLLIALKSDVAIIKSHPLFRT